jgi:hypothetical protein
MELRIRMALDVKLQTYPLTDRTSPVSFLVEDEAKAAR